MRRTILYACLLITLTVPAGSAVARGSSTLTWPPVPGTRWQVQYTGQLNQNVKAPVFDIDMFDNDASVVASLHSSAHRVICYVSAGTWEDWRPDAASFPEEAKGNPLDDWPGERWLDIRNADVRNIMEARTQMCADKGFDAIDFDNVDEYTYIDSGFPLTADDQLDYNRFLASTAHSHGLLVGLKNDLGQVDDLEPSFDFAVNEQCLTYHECDMLTPFVQNGKAVFQIEYHGSIKSICKQTRNLRFSTILKDRLLGAWLKTC